MLVSGGFSTPTATARGIPAAQVAALHLCDVAASTAASPQGLLVLVLPDVLERYQQAKMLTGDVFDDQNAAHFIPPGVGCCQTGTAGEA